MADLQSLVGVELPWVRSGYLPAAFTLRWDETEVGSLQWEKLFSSHAIARTAAGAWRIGWSGIRSLFLRDADTDQPIGGVRLHLFGSGEIALPGGTLALRRAGIFPPALRIDDPGGMPLVTVQGSWALLWRGGVCRFEPAAATVPEVGLVALLGMYIMIRRARRRARR